MNMNNSRSLQGPAGNLVFMNMLQAQMMVTNMETCPTDDFSNEFGYQGCDIDNIGERLYTLARPNSFRAHGMNCKLQGGHGRSITPQRGIVPAETVCKDIKCLPQHYSGPIPGPPRGPGGLIYVQNNSEIGHASYHFEPKPYINYEKYELNEIFSTGKKFLKKKSIFRKK